MTPEPQFRYFRDADGTRWKMPVSGRGGCIIANGGDDWSPLAIPMTIEDLLHTDSVECDGTVETDASGTALANDALVAGGAGDVCQKDCPDCKGLGGYPRCRTCLNRPTEPGESRTDSNDAVEVAFQAIWRSYGTRPRDTWETDEGWALYLWRNTLEAFTALQHATGRLESKKFAASKLKELAEARAEVERLEEVLAGMSTPKRDLAQMVFNLNKAIDDRDREAEQTAAGLRAALEAQEEAERARDRWKSHPMPDSEAPSAVWDTHYAEKDTLEDEWTRLETTARDLRAAALAGASGDGKEGA